MLGMGGGDQGEERGKIRSMDWKAVYAFVLDWPFDFAQGRPVCFQGVMVGSARSM